MRGRDQRRATRVVLVIAALAALLLVAARAAPARAHDHHPAPADEAAAFQQARPVLGGDAFDAAHDMPGMHDMHDMHDMPGMDMSTAPLGLSMERTGSGTGWQPDATPMAMHHQMAGDWMLMLHYTMHGGFDAQGTSRGDSRGFGLGWVMGMATHALGGGEFAARVMLSPEPLFDGKRGYPLLLQTGEEVGGVPLHDRQHPHDLFMEVAVRYAHALGDDVAVEVYAAPAGEPALGPVAFPHCPYALYDMTATLGHHWQDSTHVSFGVATAGVYGRRWKLEGSYFNGREPDEDRYGVDLRAPDSFAGRVTINPSAAWSLEASYGYLKAPEQHEPGVSVQRAVASATYAGHGVDATAVIGHNTPSAGPSTTASLVELSARPIPHVVPFGRVELVQKTGADLQLGAPADDDHVFTMASLGAGAVYELDPIAGVTAGLGVRGTLDVIGTGLQSFYGTTTPVGGMVYVEVHPARAR
jgi:hypothetical protein